MKPITQQAHELLALHVRGILAIDATAGNGHDTLFLAQLVGPTGTVWAFDIQPEALRRTFIRLEEQLISVELRLKSSVTSHVDGGQRNVVVLEASHAEIAVHLPAEARGQVAAIMFNLGYLPGAEKSCTTETESTLSALDAALEFLAPGGVLSVVVYPGHPGGREEAEAVRDWFGQQTRRGVGKLLTDRQTVLGQGPELLALQRC